MKIEPETNHIRAGYFFLAAAALSFLFWLFESALHVIMFHGDSLSKDPGFIGHVFSPGKHELWMRLIIVSAIFFLTPYVYSFYKLRKSKELLIAAVKIAEEERNRSDAIITGIVDGIIIQDTDYKIIYQNQIQTEKYGNRNGEYCYKVYEGRDTVCENCPVERSFSDGEVHNSERSVSTGNGTMHFELTSSPLRDADGNIVAGIKVVRDISSRKKVEEELLNYQTHLRELVDERTAELQASNELLIEEINDRQALEKSLIEIEDRERRRIGHDLHDGLGQLLTGLAFKIRGLGRKLEKGHFEGAVEAADLSVLIDEAKEQASYLSRGLSPIEMDEEGLMNALKALSSNTRKMFSVPCTFTCAEPVNIHNETALTQLYRIAQEAVTNAVKYAKSSLIEISLEKIHDRKIMTVKDNGIGIPEHADRKGGMGLKIMNYRAGLINASIDIRRDTAGGTIITCAYAGASEIKELVSHSSIK